MKKPKILITNDDGIEAKGIWHLWNALKGKADLTVVAPASEKSGTSLGLTLRSPITLNPFKWEGGTSAWKVTGTPADCVRFGMRILLEEKPDLIVSGINYGSNAGRGVLYSGTVGGVIEGALRNVPGIAFSSTSMTDPNFEAIEPYIFPLVENVLNHPLSSGTILNVNFPSHQKEFKGIKLARQGKGMWIEKPDERIHPDGDAYYWHGGEWEHHPEHEESDVALLENGFITAVPIHIDQLTDYKFLERRKEDFEAYFK
ncbi:MAG: 5'-nucleotidase SurE [Chlamydiae bacterium]|nr:5'-nucleotidase SurE [Chlamydiota bacterium]